MIFILLKIIQKIGLKVVLTPRMLGKLHQFVVEANKRESNRKENFFSKMPWTANTQTGCSLVATSQPAISSFLKLWKQTLELWKQINVISITLKLNSVDSTSMCNGNVSAWRQIYFGAIIVGAWWVIWQLSSICVKDTVDHHFQRTFSLVII